MIKDTAQAADVTDKPTALSEGSNVRLGLVLLLASYIALSSWWASAINSKLNVVVSGQQQANSDVQLLRSRVDSLERAIDKINATGSPSVRDIDKRVTELEKQLELHEKLERTKGNQ